MVVHISDMKNLCQLAVLCIIAIVKNSLAFSPLGESLAAAVDAKDELDVPHTQEESLSLLQNKLEVFQSGQDVIANQPQGGSPTWHTKDAGQSAFSHDTPNILFIVADDLLPMISSLQADQFGYMHTPNLDALVKESLVLTNSHVQQAICTPSRASVLFGRRPDTMHVWKGPSASGHNPLRGWCTQCATIPGIFKEAGYYTVGMGKIFGRNDPESTEDPQSWSDPAFTGVNWFDPGSVSPDKAVTRSWTSVNETATGPCPDSLVRDRAVGLLRNLATRQNSQPWFFAVGFRKPHNPFEAPMQFFDLYDSNSTKLADNPFAPWDMPLVALQHTSSELVGYSDIKEIGYTGGINETLPDWKAKELVHAYQACVSYFDYNVGVLLNELKTLGQSGNTIIILWSDHGYKLGQHGAWGKNSNFHVDTNAPVILRVPGLTDAGVSSQALTEHVDIMPTLLEAAGLDALPTCPKQVPWLTSHCTEGSSFLSLALSPSVAGKSACYSQVVRETTIGYSMRTTSFRFIAWVDIASASSAYNWTMHNEDCGFELYALDVDPDENHNLAYRSEFQAQVNDSFWQLQIGWPVR